MKSGAFRSSNLGTIGVLAFQAAITSGSWARDNAMPSSEVQTTCDACRAALKKSPRPQTASECEPCEQCILANSSPSQERLSYLANVAQCRLLVGAPAGAMIAFRALRSSVSGIDPKQDPENKRQPLLRVATKDLQLLEPCLATAHKSAEPLCENIPGADKVIQVHIRLPEQVDANSVSLSLDGVDLAVGDWMPTLLLDPGDHVVVVALSLPGRRTYEGQLATSKLDASNEYAIPLPACVDGLVELQGKCVTAPVIQPPTTCAVGFAQCGSQCVDLRSDPRHCGGCSVTCGSGECKAGVCQSPRNLWRTAGWISSGVGAAGIVVGSVSGLMALSKRDHLNDSGCVDGRCPRALSGDVDTLNTYRTVSSAGFIVGGVGLAAGATFLFVLPRHERKSSAQLAPWIGPGLAGMTGEF